MSTKKNLRDLARAFEREGWQLDSAERRGPHFTIKVSGRDRFVVVGFACSPTDSGNAVRVTVAKVRRKFERGDE